VCAAYHPDRDLSKCKPEIPHLRTRCGDETRERFACASNESRLRRTSCDYVHFTKVESRFEMISEKTRKSAKTCSRRVGNLRQNSS